jgi:hypothetical protein
LSTENERLSTALSVRSEFTTREALYDLETQIVKTITTLRTGASGQRPQIAEALSDRELATLELWAGDDDTFIRDECVRRQAEYEAFTRRFAPDPAAKTTS